MTLLKGLPGRGSLEGVFSRDCIILDNIHVLFPPSNSCFSCCSSPLCPFLFRLQNVHGDGRRPDVHPGSDVGVWGLPVQRGQHSGRVYFHHPQQPAGGAGLRHALSVVQTGWSARPCADSSRAGGRAFGASSNFFLPVFCCPLQVREEYAYFFACSRMPQKKRHSDFSSSNPSSSQSQVCHEKHSTGGGGGDFKIYVVKNNQRRVEC